MYFSSFVFFTLNLLYIIFINLLFFLLLKISNCNAVPSHGTHVNDRFCQGWLKIQIEWQKTFFVRQLVNLPPTPLPLDNVHTQKFCFYLPYVLTICSITPLSACSVGNPFKISFQIVRYNIRMLCFLVTFKYQKYWMFIVNLHSF